MNHQLYKKKIRRTLILFAILPVFLLAMIGIIAYYAIYIMKTDYELNKVNKEIVRVINSDRRHIDKEFTVFIKHLPKDTTEIYRALYDRTNNTKRQYFFNFEYDRQYTNNYNNTPTIPIYHRSGQHHQAPFELTVSIPVTSLKETVQFPSYQYVITDTYDNIYYSSDDEKIGEKYIYDEHKQITAFHRDKQLKIYVYQDLTQAFDRGIMLISILFGTFVLLIVITMYTSKHLAHRQTKDIDEIIARIRQAQVRALTAYEPLSAPSELEVINRYIFELSQLNERLLRSTKDSNEALRQSQLKSLENQFQPHFIFNTMQTINYMIDTDAKAAKKMMIKLSSILRYTLRVKESEVTFRKELKYLDDYLYIQNIRFDGKINYFFEINENLLDYRTEKLLIQPIVENAIKYGDINQGLNIIIRIRLLNNNDILIGVYNSGQGMTDERLQEVRSMIRHYKLRNLHIGLQNIHQTLRIKFGNKYGMKVFSHQHNGTMIVLRVKRGDISV